MKSAYHHIAEFFRMRGWKHQADEANAIVRSGFAGKCGNYEHAILVDEEHHIIQFFTLAPVRIPEGSRTAVAEAIARANYGMKVGKFEMSFSDGELRFHASSWIDDDPSHELIGAFLGLSLAAMDRYLPAVLSVIYANEVPEEAVASVELPW